MSNSLSKEATVGSQEASEPYVSGGSAKGAGEAVEDDSATSVDEASQAPTSEAVKVVDTTNESMAVLHPAMTEHANDCEVGQPLKEARTRTRGLTNVSQLTGHSSIMTLEQQILDNRWLDGFVAEPKQRCLLELCAGVLANLIRLNLTEVHVMKLMSWEVKLMNDGLVDDPSVKGPLGEVCTRFLCWRRAVLQGAGVFWSLALILRTYALIQAASSSHEGFGKDIVFGVQLGDYAEHFRLYIIYGFLASAMTVASNVIAIVLAFRAAWLWRDPRRSRPYAIVSYILGWVTPFLVYNAISFRSGVDIEGIQMHVCRDLMSGRYKDQDWPARPLLDNLGGTSILGLSERIAALFDGTSIDPKDLGIALSVTICDRPPREWGDMIAEVIKEKGRLQTKRDQPCPAAEEARLARVLSAAGLHPSLAKNISSTGAEVQQICSTEPCAYCKSEECLKLTDAQQSLGAGERKMELLTQLFAENATRCWDCATPRGLELSGGTTKEWSCASLCVPLWAAEAQAPVVVRLAKKTLDNYTNVTDRARRAGSLAEALDACLMPEDLASLQVLVRTATASSAWELMLGFRIAFEALGLLLPTTFALMSGTIRGAMIAKFVIPYSRIPALILTCAIAYTLPNLLMLLVVLKCLIGDATLMPTIFCLLGSLVVFLPWQMFLGSRKLGGARDLAIPQNHVEAEKAIAFRQKLQLFFYIGVLVMLMLWLTQWAPFLVQLGGSGFLPVDVGSFRMTMLSTTFLQSLGFTVLTVVFNFFGISRIAGVCFADAVLYAVMLVDEANVDKSAVCVDAAAALEAGDPSVDEVALEVALFAELHLGLLCREPDLQRKVLCTNCGQTEVAKVNLPRFRVNRDNSVVAKEPTGSAKE